MNEQQHTPKPINIFAAPASDSMIAPENDPDFRDIKFSTSSQMNVRFFCAHVRIHNESPNAVDKQGKPIFNGMQPRDMIEIQPLADLQTAICRQATEQDKAMYPHQWNAYAQGIADMQVMGTRISDLPGISRRDAEFVAAYGVLTIEQAAEMNEHVLQKLGLTGGTVKAQAKAYLERNEESGGMMGLAARLAALEASEKSASARNQVLVAALAEKDTQLAILRESIGGRTHEGVVHDTGAVQMGVNMNPTFDDLGEDDGLVGGEDGQPEGLVDHGYRASDVGVPDDLNQ